MTKKVFICLIALVSISYVAKSQNNSQDNVVFTVDKQPISIADFERFYLKSLDYGKDKPTSASVDEYLELFKKYKLKVHEAYQLKLDTVPNFISELEMYRDGLAKPYLTDKEVTDALIAEAYDRLKYEIKASHILVFCNADEIDTTIAYNKIKAIWDKVKAGKETFEKLAFDESEDPSAKDNSGSLGYFTSLNMIYSFENMAYNTPVGQVSPIFRTEYGYHIIKVFDKRENKGEIKVADLLLQYTPGATPAENAEVDRRINAIYDQIKAGAKWEDMVAKYSDDYDTKPNAGEMNWFSATEKRLPEELVNAAFTIQNKGDICKPVKIGNGWMILKKLDQKPLASFDDMKSYFKQRISRDSRSNKSEAVMIQKIKNNHSLVLKPENVKLFVKTLDSAILIGSFDKNGWTSSNPKIKNNEALKIDNDVFTLSDFAEYIFKAQAQTKSKNIEGLTNKYYNEFVDASCITFLDHHLAELYPEYKYLYQEYKDGILVFNLMDMKVWSPGVVDTIQQQKFYDVNKNNYMWADRYDIDVYNARTKKIYKTLKKQLSKAIKGNKSLSNDSLLRYHNSKNPLNLNIQYGKFEQKDSNEFAEAIFKNSANKSAVNKLHSIGKVRNDEFVWVVIHKFIASQPKTLDEAKGPVINDLQTQIEKDLLIDLAKKYPVIVNQLVFDAFKSKMISK